MYDVEWEKEKKRSAPLVPGLPERPYLRRLTETAFRDFVGTEALALTPGLYRVVRAISPPRSLRGALLPIGEEEPLEGTSVSAVHSYPLRSPGFEEPLFPTGNSKRAIMEHLACAPWLFRGSELSCGGGEVAHRREEPAHVLAQGDGRAYLVRRCPNGQRTRKRRVVRVLERWREVARWWEEGRSVDRFVFRVLLSGGAVVDLALERSGGWFLVGVAD